jgi:site-specific recombinase XerC
MNQVIALYAPSLPELAAAAGERAGMAFLEFFTAKIHNPHTRRAYPALQMNFWLGARSVGVPSIAAVQRVHVATWIEVGTREFAAPSVKQRLATIRHLFDWLVTGQVVPVNPAGSVRGPRHVVTSGQTPVLDPAEARSLLDSIDTAFVMGLRDRALIGLMVYSFARIGAPLGMAVEDVYTAEPPAVGEVAREGRHAAHDAVPPQPQGKSHRLSRRRRPARRSQGAAVPHESAVAPASSPARCCRRRTAMR